MNKISDAKLKASILAGIIGITVFLSTEFLFRVLYEGVDDGIKMICRIHIQDPL